MPRSAALPPPLYLGPELLSAIARHIRREHAFPRGRAGTFPHLPSRRVSHPAGGGCADRRSPCGGANGTPSSDRARFTPQTPHQPGFFVPSFWDKTRRGAAAEAPLDERGELAGGRGAMEI